MAHLTTNAADKDRFVCIYPAYVNSKRKRSQGRRIATDRAVENPSVAEIGDVLSAAGMNVYVERDKTHPREHGVGDPQARGRVRVQLRREDGSLCQDRFSSRDALMLHAAQMIPKLKSRSAATHHGGHKGGEQGATVAAAGGKTGKKKRK